MTYQGIGRFMVRCDYCHAEFSARFTFSHERICAAMAAVFGALIPDDVDTLAERWWR